MVIQSTWRFKYIQGFHARTQNDLFYAVFLSHLGGGWISFVCEMASLAMTTTEWVNVSVMEWEDAPANMLRRSGGLLCNAWGCRKKHCLSAGSVSRMCQLFFYYIFWSFWNRWILKWQTNNSKFSSFSVGSSKAFSLWQVGKKSNDARFYSSLCMFFLSDVIWFGWRSPHSNLRFI